MSECNHQAGFSRRRKVRQDKWKRRLAQLAQMRAAKERKRLANATEREPQMIKWHRFEFGIRDKITGEVGWHDLVSGRHATKAIGLILKHYA